MSSLRIAITSLYLPGSSKIGVGHQVHHFANALIDRGHDVTVFSPDVAGDGARYVVEHVDPGRSLRTFRFGWRLRDVDLSTFDILHAHGDDTFLVGHRRPPHVRTMHGSCFAEARRIPGAKEKARMALLGAGEVVASVAADRTVAVSAATTRVYPWIRDVIPCGVDVARFGAAVGDREASPTILFVGTYENRKRGRLLAEAFTERVLPAIPDARLWMVCSDAPPAPGIDVLGRLSDDELVDRYRRAWVFCLPSSYEGFGVPYIEALAAGCPVVATPNPGAREVLGDGAFGRIVEPDGLGEALAALLTDADSRAELEKIGRARAAQYDWSEIVTAYEQVYASVRRR
ncbi:MAG TPA: glycosyltransferase family 4 protein [Acidimicrobiia bacterium]|jgi:glycosyltransferase involved in cell wall biosynthesis